MRRKRMAANLQPGEAEAEASAQGGKGSDSGRQGRGGDAEQGAVQAGGAGAPPVKPHAIPPNHRELGRAIFAKADPVKAGSEILEPGEERADPTRLNALKTFADWVYGRPDAQGHYTPPRVIWDLPCPAYERTDPEEQN